jgi:hypothetical protein
MMLGLNKALQAMPAAVACCMVLNPRWSTLPLAIWFLLVVAFEAVNGFRFGSPWMERRSLPSAFQWFGGGSVLLYALMAMGLGWTENSEAGWFALEVKFSLLLIPLLMLHHWKRQGRAGLKWVPFSMAGGLVAFMILRLTIAGFSGDPDMWRYDGLAGPFHPTYMGLYLVMMPVLLARDWRFYGVILALSGLFVGMLASKAGWIVAALLWGGMIALNKDGRRVRPMGVAVGLAGVFIGSWLGDGGRWSEFARFVSSEVVSQPISQTEVEVEPLLREQAMPAKTGSSAGRMQAWQASVDVLLKTPLGVGTGDVTDALCEEYRKSGSAYALQKRMNPHSAWLQLAVSHGWMGLVFILFWWSGVVVLAFRTQNVLLLVWSIAWALNGTIESLLELQQGVVPTVLLCCVFALRDSPRLKPIQD